VPFREWDLPAAIRHVRGRILKRPKGDRAFVELLMTAREFGLETLHVAPALVLDGNVVTAAVVMNEIRLTAPSAPILLNVPDMLKLRTEPRADCGRYDHLHGGSHANVDRAWGPGADRGAQLLIFQPTTGSVDGAD
jgi:hypothetical protein